MRRRMFWSVLGLVVLGAILPIMAATPAGAAPPAPTPISPANGASATSNPTFTWSAAAGATSYRVQIAKVADFSTLVFDLTTVNTNATPTADLPQAVLYWRVLAHDGTGDSPWSTVFTVNKQKGSAPTNLAPANHAVLAFPNQPASFTWDPLAGVSGYEIEIAYDSLFTPPLIASTIVANPSYTFPTPQPIGQSFYWHVRGLVSGGNTTSFSPTYDYSVSWASAPHLTYPPNVADPSIEEVVFSWDPVPGAVSYDIEVSPDVDFGTLSFGTNTKATTYAPQVTLPNATYYWRVRPRNAGGGQGSWSHGNHDPAPDTPPYLPSVFTKAWPSGNPPYGPYSTVTLISPANGATGVYIPTFSWNPVRLADHYQLDLSTDSTFSNNVSSCVTNHTTYTPYQGCDPPFAVDPSPGNPNPDPVFWYWRVRPLDGPQNILGLWSPTFSFTRATKMPIPPPYVVTSGSTTTLTGPANCRAAGGCPDQYDTPTFTWNFVSGATSYQVIMATDVNFTNVVATYSTPYPVFTPIESLNDGQAGLAKFWYARPCFSNGSCGPDPQSFAGLPASSSPVWSFRKQSYPVVPLSPGTVDTPPADPFPGNPAPPVAYPYADQITFKWTDYLLSNLTQPTPVTQEARQYRVLVYGTRDLSVQIDDSGFIDQTTYTASSKTFPEGPLWWRVQAIDGSNNAMTFSPVWSLEKRSRPIDLLTPSADATVSRTPAFTWAPQNFAYSYQLEVYTNVDQPLAAVNRVLDQTTIAAAFTPSGTFGAGTYGWRVRRYDADGRPGPWSATTSAELRKFTLAPTATTLLTPANGSSSPGKNLLFTWTPVLGAVQYRLEASTTPTFSNLSDSSTTVMTAYAPSNAYDPNATFYWRVRTLDAGNNVLATSATFSFGPKVAGAPTGVTATPDDASALVSWTPPASDGGSPITSYRITATPGGATTVVPNGTSGTFGGLVNGTSYTFKVAAINVAGTGPDSAASNAVVPRTTPDPPATVTASAGNGSAQVTWTVPPANGGAAITGYRITTQPTGATKTVGNVLTTSIAPLDNGTAYTFTVAAINAAGTGVESAQSNTVIPSGPAGPPTGVTATPGDTAANVSWTPPLSDNGAIITGYRITASPGSIVKNVGNVTSTSFGGLTNGVSYTFKVATINGAGTGVDSSPSNAVTPFGVPGAPTALSATPGNTTAQLTWAAPGSNGGSAITGYDITVTPGGAKVSVGNVLTASVPGLTNGTPYTFKVQAVNARGAGALSSASNSVTPRTVAGAPTAVVGTPANGAVALNWVAPASNGGAAITGYVITASPGGLTLTVGNVLSANFGGLANGTAYTFKVAAINAAGTGAASTASAAITPRTVPGAPTGATAVRGNTNAVISWTAPASTGGSPITGYIITASPGGATQAVGLVTSTTFGNLTNGTAYTFTVAATNAAGTGASSAPTSPVTPIALGAAFHPLVPARLLDSRLTTGNWNGPLVANTDRALKVTGVGGVPSSASAVIMNVTVTGATIGSFVTLYPSGAPKPNASNLNFGAGQTIPNLVTVKVGDGGNVNFSNAVGATDVIADVVGYFDDGTVPGDLFNGVTPSRILDSRLANGWSGKIAAGVPGVRNLQVANRGGVPTTATSVVMNVTVTGSDTPSFLQAWPTGAARPTSSNLNFAAGETIPNLVTVQLGTGGQVSFFNAAGNTDVIADVVGYFDPSGGSRFHPLANPARVLDDRVGVGLSGPWTAGQTRALQVGGTNNVPAGSTGLIMNTTVTGGTAGSFVTVFPDGAALPVSSNLNFGPGQTIPNLVMVQLPPNGKIDLFNAVGSVDIISDVVGYYATT